MKTINTVLPIYDRLSKQCYERSKGVSGDKSMKIPVITPQFRLPSFQWNSETTDMGNIINIELIDGNGNSVGGYNIFTGWENGSFDTLTSSGLDISSGITSNLNDYAKLTEDYIGVAGDVIKVRGTFTSNSGGIPVLQLYSGGYTAGTWIRCEPGYYEYSFTLPVNGTYEIRMWGVPNPGTGDFSFTGVSVSIEDFAAYFVSFPVQTSYDGDYYYIYEGDTLNYLLPIGLYYLKITMEHGYILYSDWFLVDCVYPNLISSWANIDYETFDSEGTAIYLIETGADGNARSDDFSVRIDETIRVVFYQTLHSGVQPTMYVYSGGVISDIYTVVAGVNDHEFTVTANSDTAYIYIDNDAAANFSMTEVLLMRIYSDKYLTIQFFHSCNLGEIIYEDGFEQYLWLDSETMEPTFPYTEKGQENGYGQFVATFQRQDKVYIIRTNLVPQFIVDVLHRLKLHDNIALTDIVGDAWIVKEIEVEHEWQFSDKYYALATITVNLDEGIVITGCCTAINECN